MHSVCQVLSKQERLHDEMMKWKPACGKRGRQLLFLSFIYSCIHSFIPRMLLLRHSVVTWLHSHQLGEAVADPWRIAFRYVLVSYYLFEALAREFPWDLGYESWFQKCRVTGLGTCQCPLTVKHILMDRVDFNDVRNKHFVAFSIMTYLKM